MIRIICNCDLPVSFIILFILLQKNALLFLISVQIPNLPSSFSSLLWFLRLRFRYLFVLLFFLCLNLGGERFRHDSIVLCLFVSHRLEFNHVKYVAFALWILQLLNQVLVSLMSLIRLNTLLELLGRHGGSCLSRLLLTILGLGGLEALLTTSFLSDGLQPARINLLLVLTDSTRDDRLLLLMLDAEFEIHVKLLLRGCNDGALCWQQFLQNLERLLLTLECLSELLSAILAESDSLVAAGSLDVLFSKHVSCLVSVKVVCLER